jgi:hypothetical protein
MSIQPGPEWQQFAARLAAAPADLDSRLRVAMTTSLLMVERDARRTVAQDTRRLSGSITHRITGTGRTLEGRVGPSVQYGRFVEFGRRPGRMPPGPALVGWVRRHSELRFARRTADREAELLRRAWALARAIDRRGIRAQPFLRPAYQRNQPTIQRMFRAARANVVMRLAGGPGGTT